jgi:hypothetical protein
MIVNQADHGDTDGRIEFRRPNSVNRQKETKKDDEFLHNLTGEYQFETAFQSWPEAGDSVEPLRSPHGLNGGGKEKVLRAEVGRIQQRDGLWFTIAVLSSSRQM